MSNEENPAVGATGAGAPENNSGATGAPGASEAAGTGETSKGPQINGDEPWLTPRLEQAARAAETKRLKELGVSSWEEAAEKFSKLTTLEREKLSEKERLDAELADAKAKAEKADSYLSVIKSRHEREFGKLSESQRKAVEKIAGDDPVAQLRAIDALSDTWSHKPDDNPKGKGEEKPKPRDTAPSKRGPSDDGGSTSPIDHRARYQELKKTNPVQAGIYLTMHESEIYPRA